MKNFFYLLILSASLTYCTAVESVTETEESTTEEEEKFSPEWFDSQIASSSDSIAFYGYSHATASDSADAAELAGETAIVNLLFEIDRFAEEIREKAEETTGSGQYSSGGFVYTLRTSVQELDLSVTSVTHEHRTDDEGVHHHFSRTEIPRDEVKSLLSDAINDDVFKEELERTGTSGSLPDQ